MKFAAVFVISTLALADVSARPSNIEYRVSAAGTPAKMEAVLYAKHADYPAKAYDHHWQGKGWFALKISSNGWVASVTILQSTGHSVLDRSAIAALQEWRFRPGSIGLVRVPVVYFIGQPEEFKDSYRPASYGDCDEVLVGMTPPSKAK